MTKQTETNVTKEYRNGYCTPELRKAMRDAVSDYAERIMDGENVTVHIENGNRKTHIPSVSLPPYITCPAVCKGTCDGKCYAGKLCVIYKNVLNAYARNLAIWQAQPEKYFDAIKKAAINVRFFRYHVAGDIPNADYFGRMVKLARELPNTTFLCFTKRYAIVNTWIDNSGAIPDNLKVLFSGWHNLEPENPHNMPETTVYKKKEDPDPSWLLCGGNCLECACRGVGCWQLKDGEKLAFEIH